MTPQAGWVREPQAGQWDEHALLPTAAPAQWSSTRIASISGMDMQGHLGLLEPVT